MLVTYDNENSAGHSRSRIRLSDPNRRMRDRADKVVHPRRTAGFSIIELLMSVAIVFVVTGMAVIEMQPLWRQLEANAGLDQVKSTIRQAREISISQRRTTILQFVAAPATSCPAAGNINFCIELTQMVVNPGPPPTQAAAAAPFLIIPIESNVQLLSLSGEVDTPDGFLGAAPTAPNGLYFGATAGAPASGMEFQSDGTFTDGNGTPINLSVFLAVAGVPSSERAVTILGNTGRVFGYHGTGASNSTAWIR